MLAKYRKTGFTVVHVKTMTTARHQIFRRARIAALSLATLYVAGAANVGAADTDARRPKEVSPRTGQPKPTDKVSKELLEKFKKEREEFLNSQKDSAKDAKDVVKDELKGKSAVNTSREEAKDSIAAARERAREQARKLAEEAKEQAERERKRD